jgi:hypothetical protein
MVSGFLNVSRARHSDGLTRAFSVVGNLLILVLAVGIAWPVRYHLFHNCHALGILVVTVVELLFALRGDKPFILAGFEHFGSAHSRVHAVALCQQISRDAEPFRIE